MIHTSIVRNSAQEKISMDDVKFKANIANHLKMIRKKQGLSLDATAKLTGVSKAMLGQIERQESSPTIAKLWQIASGLETSFSAFFATDQQLRLSENIFPGDPRMKVTTVFSYAEDTQLEMFQIELCHFHEQLSGPHAHGVIEHIYVLSGSIEIYLNGVWRKLLVGDSLKFYADQQHGYRAVTENAVFQNIVSYPGSA